MLILSIKKSQRSVGWHTPAITIFGSRGKKIRKEFKVISCCRAVSSWSAWAESLPQKLIQYLIDFYSQAVWCSGVSCVFLAFLTPGMRISIFIWSFKSYVAYN